MRKTCSTSYFNQYWKCYRLWGSDSDSDQFKKEVKTLRHIEKLESITNSFRLLTKEEIENQRISVYKPIL